VPTLIHEQNRWPGATNRLLARWVDRIAVSFEGTAGLVGRRGRVTGNPVRPEFAAIEPWRSPRGAARLLAFGGSRGARSINDALVAALPGLPADLRIRHQTGPADHARVAAAYLAAGRGDARVEPYIDDMAGALAAADLVVCRAGASTLAELAIAGRASVLVPFPHAAHDHQRHNARAFVEAGAARMIDPVDLDGRRLAATVASLAADPAALGRMAAAARSLARPGAAVAIADLAEGLLERAA
jgi:UDP-N-acetylglucosamine--N-acetylmuramyl-(pentapeptide) pyrophosphoryl-undecaprenol N-acetylglucosamine transferase